VQDTQSHATTGGRNILVSDRYVFLDQYESDNNVC